MQYIIDRLKERSTWVGIIALLAALGVTLDPEQAEAVAALGVAAAGAVAVLTKG